MMHKGMLIVIAAAALATACASPVEPARNDTSVEAPIESGAAHYLVWWAVEEGGYTTALVRESGETAEVVAESDGLYVMAGDAVWEWREEPVETRQVDCSCAMERDVSDDGTDTDTTCDVARDVPAITLVELGSDRELSVSVPEASMEGEFESNPYPTGSFAGVLTVTECSYSYGCGAAHGAVDCRFSAWNLNDATELTADQLVEPLSQADQLSLLASSTDEEVDVESLLGLVEVDPTWSETGKASLVATYAASACYACTDGEWSSYTVTASDDNARPKLAIEDAPTAVLDTWRSAPGPRGWSHVPNAALDRLRTALK